MADERDLGAMLHRLLREVLRREREIFESRDLPMWDYVALVRLETGPARTQLQLAAQMGRDKTRLIETLDRLGDRGLVRREPDPADRRNRIVALTPDGRSELAAARAEVRSMEDELLGGLSATARRGFLSALRSLDDGRHSDSH